MKVLFLDIDGVLNSRRSAIAFNGYPSILDENEDKFDKVAVELIKRVCSQGVSIVLSSTWRLDKNFKKILGLPIIDRTESLSGKCRGEEIQKWLDKNKVDKWAIIDDDSDMLDSQIKNFAHVDGKNGIMWADYENLCKILDVTA